MVLDHVNYTNDDFHDDVDDDGDADIMITILSVHAQLVKLSVNYKPITQSN